MASDREYIATIKRVCEIIPLGMCCIIQVKYIWVIVRNIDYTLAVVVVEYTLLSIIG